jgi:preprotein translocase SecE subunit
MSNTLSQKTTAYLKDAYAEIKNITWTSKKEVKQHTILVIAISVFVALFLGLCDYVLSFGVQQLITLVK